MRNTWFLSENFKYIKHRIRMINTEEKRKVVIAVWGTEIIQFLSMLAIIHQDDLKNRMNCTSMISRKE